MASADSFASWHPAFRPNSDAIDVSAPIEVPAIKPVNATIEIENIPSEPSFEELAKEDVTTQNVDAWFSEDTNADEDNWLPDYQDRPVESAVESQPLEKPEPEAPEAQPLEPQAPESHAPAPTSDESTQGAAAEAPAITKTETEAITEAEAPKQMNWDDGDAGADDGADWFLNRSESNDPLQFLPASDRSNSFPAVPPLDQPVAAPKDRSLPRSQVEDLMEEEEHNSDAIFTSTGMEEDVSAARYEEGLPLISQVSSHALPPSEAEPTAARVDDAFVDEEDDFFSNVVHNAEPSFEPRPLDRKSTFQAMGQPKTSAAQVSALGATLEEEIVEESQPEASQQSLQDGKPHVEAPAVADATPVTAEGEPNEDSKVTDEDALAAKWSEAFADDELLEDEFLPDDVATESKGAKEIDPAAFFGSDDEGFLDDVEDEKPSSAPVLAQVPAAAAPSPTTAPSASQNRYAPQIPPASKASNPYAPTTTPNAFNPPPVIPPPVGYSATAPPQATLYGGPPPRPSSQPKAQSFVDKSKGGYTSPYDLPMDVVDAVKPRKRPSLQQRSSSIGPASPPSAPPRSASAYGHGPPPHAGPPSPVAAGASTPPPLHRTPSVPPKAKESFFEELPITSKPRPSSRHGRTSSPAPVSPLVGPPPGPLSPPSRALSLSAAPPLAPPPSHPPVQSTTHSAVPGAGLVAPELVNPYAPPPPTAPHSTPMGPPGVANLVQPERVNPYAPMPSQLNSSPSVTMAGHRYSPSPDQLPPHLNGTATSTISNRYSPAPTGSRQPSAHYAAPPVAAHPPAILPHQPRTSSPLAHFEISANRASHIAPGPNGEIVHGDRRTSLPHEPRIHRIPSLPPTREVDEEQEQASPKSNHSAHAASASIAGARYSPVTVPGPRSTPPPPLQPNPAQTTLSPPKRSPYTPLSTQSSGAKEHSFPPPPRSFSQSPTSLQRSVNGQIPHESPRRSAPAQAPVSPKTSQPPAAPAYVPTHRPRAPSLAMNMVPPTDGRERDPLQRWKGVPILVWGVGGTIISTFPKSVPRYGISQTAPMIVRTPGEVKIKHVKDILPLEERLSKFPGPLKGKSKKKETLAWLSSGIDSLTNEVPDLTYSQNPSHEEKRSVERLVLWKILRVFIENDGVLEGNPAVQKAVRDILMPGLDEKASENALAFGAGQPAATLHQSGAGIVQADAVDGAGIEVIRKHLLVGDREKAAWAAVDKRLWGHAMLIANTVSPDLYKQVAQEFVRKEVNYPGHNNESIAALYKVLSGNHDECVDELVPVHARAGLQLIAASSTNTSTTDSLGGLDKWRETLCLVLGNRSPEDVRAINALGGLLASYGRAEAAHVCFIFARHASVFGGIDDPRSNFVLIGSDHRGQADRFFKDAEALLLSEVYEYGLSLSGTGLPFAPHLAGYKLQLASTLAEYGQRDRALQYCEGILNAIGSQTKRSPYHHPMLEQAVEDFIKRLKQAPKEESNSWIPKPSMNKVSDTMWSTFNKFVSGDDNDGSGNGTNGDVGAESGPFAKIAGGTPTISRSPSVSNFESYGTSQAGYPMGPAPTGMNAPSFAAAPAPPASRTASRYAPLPQQGQATAPANPYEPTSSYTPRSSSEVARHQPNHYEPSRPSTGYQPQPPQQQQYNPAPVSQQGYQPTPTAPAPQPTVSQSPSYPLPTQTEAPSYPGQAPAATSSAYAPLGVQESTHNPTPSQELAGENAMSNGQIQDSYQTLSYGYQPPSFTPAAAADTPVEAAAETAGGEQTTSSDAYEPPSFQSYGYEPPSYEPQSEPSAEEEDGPAPRPKKKGIMYDDDDDDDIPGLKPREKTKAEKDRENEEMIRRVAEEEGKPN